MGPCNPLLAALLIATAPAGDGPPDDPDVLAQEEGAAAELFETCTCAVPRRDKTGLIFIEGSTSAALQLNWQARAGGGRAYSVALRPAAGTYVSNSVYVRLGFGFEWDQAAGQTTFTAGAVPSVGIFVPLTPHLAFTPWVGVNLAYSHQRGASTSDSGLTAAAEASLSLVIPLVEHFSLSIGPDVSQAFFASRGVTRAGRLAITLGVIGSW